MSKIIEDQEPKEPEIIEEKAKTAEMREHSKQETSIDPMHLVKHPLEHKWDFWMFTNLEKIWKKNMVHLTSFHTVEDYWCLFHHMKQPSELEQGQEYWIFKDGIKPWWEDGPNEKGGRWLVAFDKKRSDLDSLWLDTVLLAIGESFLNSKLICGVMVSVKMKCKICVWTSDHEDKNGNLEIGQLLKYQLGIGFKIGYQKHNISKNLYLV